MAVLPGFIFGCVASAKGITLFLHTVTKGKGPS